MYMRLIIIIFLTLDANLILARQQRKPVPREQISKLIQDLKSSDSVARCNAAATLDYTEDPGEVKKHITHFIKLARSGDSCEKGAAIETLSKLSPENQEVMQVALLLLESVDVDLHWRAANAVQAIVCGHNKQIKFAALVERYQQYKKNPGINTRLLRAVSCFGDESFPLVKSELHSTDRFVQSEAIQLLCSMGQSTSKIALKKEILEILRKFEPSSDNKDIWKASVGILELHLKTVK